MQSMELSPTFHAVDKFASYFPILLPAQPAQNRPWPGASQVDLAQTSTARPIPALASVPAGHHQRCLITRTPDPIISYLSTNEKVPHAVLCFFDASAAMIEI